jgi:predicted phosphodiesterase
MMTKRERETAVVCLADLHYGKETKSYDPDVFQVRLHHLGDRLMRIHDLLSPSYEFEGLVVAALGDWVDGSGIYPGQATTQRVGNVEQQARDVAAVLTPWLQVQASIWNGCRVECVAGNHGRVGDRASHEAASWDVVAYRYLRMMVEPFGIEVGFNDAPDDPFVRPVTIRGHQMLLYHGHEWGRTIRGRQTRIYEWQAVHERTYRVVMSGHFHVAEFLQANRLALIQAGTFVSDDHHAMRKYGSLAEPTTWVFGVGDRRPVTWLFPIYLHEERRNDGGSH